MILFNCKVVVSLDLLTTVLNMCADAFICVRRLVELFTFSALDLDGYDFSNY